MIHVRHAPPARWLAAVLVAAALFALVAPNAVAGGGRKAKRDKAGKARRYAHCGSEKSDKSRKSGKSWKSGKSRKCRKAGKSRKSGKYGKYGRPAKSRKSWKSGKSSSRGRQHRLRNYWGFVRSLYARRGGNRAGSNPTTVPVVDFDFMLMTDWTRKQIRAPKAHSVTRGAGVVVAVLDGGFNLGHPQIRDRILHGLAYDAVDEDAYPQDLGNGFDDDYDGYGDSGVGHGTFVAGMVLAAAPEAAIVPVRVRDDEGWGTNAEMVRALEYVLALRPHVVNISAQVHQGGSRQVAKLIRALRQSGVVVVGSAGNAGEEALSGLGYAPDLISVGAVDRYDAVADFSNYSYDPAAFMVFAPGVDLYGPLGTPAIDSSGYWSGTSFSAGLISGAAALVRAVDPMIGPAEVMDWLRWAVDPIENPAGDPLPFGRINLWKAVNR